MLSAKNIEKLCVTGLYKCEPDVKYRGTIHAHDLYHCCNWTFRIRKEDDKYLMVDTYWCGNGGLYIELTDKNFDDFTLIFDCKDVKEYKLGHIEDYDEDDWWHVAVDSGGMYCGGHYFIKKDAKPVKERVLDRLLEEIESAEHDLQSAKRNYEQVKSGEIGLEYA